MAGDWIKMSVGLRSNPKVVRMASALKADRLRVIGGLWAVWCVFDQHSSDGDLPGYTAQVMDEEIGWKGFSQAMQAVEWLEITDSGITVPRFDEHNGASAKRRAQDTQRKRTSRNQPDECPHDKRTENGQTSASQAPKTVTREEKRREEREKTGRVVDPRPDPSPSAPAPTRLGTRLPADWTLPDDWRQWCVENRPDLSPEVTADRFRDFWVAKPGKDGRKADWQATWRNWCRGEKPGQQATQSPIPKHFAGAI